MIGWQRRDVGGRASTKFVGTGRRRYCLAVAASLSVALTVPLALGLSPSLAAAAPTPSPYDPALFASAGLASVTLPAGGVVFDTNQRHDQRWEPGSHGMKLQRQDGGWFARLHGLRGPGPTIPAGTTVQAVGSLSSGSARRGRYQRGRPVVSRRPPDGRVWTCFWTHRRSGRCGGVQPERSRTSLWGRGGGFGGTGGTGGPATNNGRSVVAPGGSAGPTDGLPDQSLAAMPGSDGGAGATCPSPGVPQAGGGGGGAVVIAALGAVDVSGVISANGAMGSPSPDLQHAAGGGGSGGAIVRSVPQVTVDGFLCAVGASGEAQAILVIPRDRPSSTAAAVVGGESPWLPATPSIWAQLTPPSTAVLAELRLPPAPMSITTTAPPAALRAPSPPGRT